MNRPFAPPYRVRYAQHPAISAPVASPTSKARGGSREQPSHLTAVRPAATRRGAPLRGPLLPLSPPRSCAGQPRRPLSRCSRSCIRLFEAAAEAARPPENFPTPGPRVIAARSCSYDHVYIAQLRSWRSAIAKAVLHAECQVFRLFDRLADSAPRWDCGDRPNRGASGPGAPPARGPSYLSGGMHVQCHL
jgi:hypothetical protein